MRSTRRVFLQVATTGLISGVTKAKPPGRVDQPPDRRLHFVQIDVFASERLQGNPLAVFTDARGLSDTEMQSIAREVNLQETTFVLPRPAAVERDQGVKVRIFTPNEELPFAGHPTLGTAMVLRNRLANEASAEDCRSRLRPCTLSKASRCSAPVTYIPAPKNRATRSLTSASAGMR